MQTYPRLASAGGGASDAAKVDLVRLPTEMTWTLNYQPSGGFTAGIWAEGGVFIDGGSHATAQPAVDEVVAAWQDYRLRPTATAAAAEFDAYRPPVKTPLRLGWTWFELTLAVGTVGCIWWILSWIAP